MADARYDAVLAAMQGAEAHASSSGWTGAELQAHVFLAALDAASPPVKGPTMAEMDADTEHPEPEPQTPLPAPTEEQPANQERDE